MRAERAERAQWLDAERAAHRRAIASAHPAEVAWCDRCEGEGKINAGYEDAHECRECWGTGTVLERAEPTDGDALEAIALEAAAVPVDVAIARVREMPWSERP